ncbi:MAG: hypothetical protein KIH09_10280, partial [Candidatus Freyarchaeota archaeon]|nr:hypothetical protein [Candidatus Jordarchaeia archaeon]
AVTLLLRPKKGERPSVFYNCANPKVAKADFPISSKDDARFKFPKNSMCATKIVENGKAKKKQDN